MESFGKNRLDGALGGNQLKDLSENASQQAADEDKQEKVAAAFFEHKFLLDDRPTTDQPFVKVRSG